LPPEKHNGKAPLPPEKGGGHHTKPNLIKEPEMFGASEAGAKKDRSKVQNAQKKRNWQQGSHLISIEEARAMTQLPLYRTKNPIISAIVGSPKPAPEKGKLNGGAVRMRVAGK